jgi:transcriptional regulator with XRE-family HTH domain
VSEPRFFNVTDGVDRIGAREPSMPRPVGPAVARERLRTRLRELRETLGLAADQVAREMFWSPSKLNRIETGVVTIQPIEVQALLERYGIQDKEEVSTLMSLAVVSRTRQWWSQHRLNGEYQQFIAFEAEASRINVYQALCVPGLLQTEEYAQAITSAIMRRDAGDPDVAGSVKVRMNRQRGLFKRLEEPNPPELVAFLDEAVLRRPVGGAAVLRTQLDHLLKVAERPQIALHVVPFKLGAHPGLGGTFELLELADSEDPSVLFVEAATKDSVFKDVDRTGEIRENIEVLKSVSLSGGEALQMIRDIRDSSDN